MLPKIWRWPQRNATSTLHIIAPDLFLSPRVGATVRSKRNLWSATNQWPKSRQCKMLLFALPACYRPLYSLWQQNSTNVGRHYAIERGGASSSASIKKTSLKTLLNRLYLLVHPDLFAEYPKEQVLNSYMGKRERERELRVFVFYCSALHVDRLRMESPCSS